MLDHYMYNAEFTIKCDHKPLKYLLESPMQNKKGLTMGFDYLVVPL